MQVAGAGAARRPSGFRGDPEVASALVIPRLAAIGPQVDLRSARSPYYEEDSGRRMRGVARFAQVLTATVIGLGLLFVPMSALLYVAQELAGVVTVNAGTKAPGVAPVVPKDGQFLDPALKARTVSR